MLTLSDLNRLIRLQSNEKRAKTSAWFFKTGKGEYGEGDQFVGLTTPQVKKLIQQFGSLSLSDIDILLNSPLHEKRSIGVGILTTQFARGSNDERQQIYNFYLSHTQRINNWDLVDISADRIVGEFLRDKPRSILKKLARSESLWERRISIMSTFQFIKVDKEYKDTFEIAEILLHDSHDLIQKAVGWMLREVGKRISQEKEEEFLKKHYKTMPRTMLRYAIERFPPPLRLRYLKGRV